MLSNFTNYTVRSDFYLLAST